MNESQINKLKIPILESNRLKLTPLSMVFATEKYVNWMNDPEVSHLTGLSLEDVRQIRGESREERTP